MSLTTDAGEATVKAACALFDVSRAAFCAARKAPVVALASTRSPGRPRGVPAHELLAGIRRVLDRQPGWGHRNVWATLRREGLRASRRRVWAVMRAHGEVQEAHAPRPTERRRGQVVVPEPNRRFATDLTTVWTRRCGLVAVVLTVDCGCRSVLDVTATKSQESGPVLASVDRALEAAFGTPELVPEGVELRSDHGSQYTGADAAALTARWGVMHTFAPADRPATRSPSARSRR